MVLAHFIYLIIFVFFFVPEIIPSRYSIHILAVYLGRITTLHISVGDLPDLQTFTCPV
jgi:hypothetical protein